jgi:hypothetical protein
LFFCLAALAREILENGYDVDYASAKEGFESVCFDHCIGIIKGASDPAVQTAIEGIATISLSVCIAYEVIWIVNRHRQAHMMCSLAVASVLAAYSSLAP